MLFSSETTQGRIRKRVTLENILELVALFCIPPLQYAHDLTSTNYLFQVLQKKMFHEEWGWEGFSLMKTKDFENFFTLKTVEFYLESIEELFDKW